MAQATFGLRRAAGRAEVGSRPAGLVLRGRLGFASGLLVAICSIGFLVMNLALLSPPWRGMTDYIASFNSTQMLWMIPTRVPPRASWC